MKNGVDRTVVPIDKDIPMPVTTRGQQYPWKQMEIGDSFLAVVKTSSNLSKMKKQAELDYGVKFITRTTSEGVRVWRVA